MDGRYHNSSAAIPIDMFGLVYLQYVTVRMYLC